MHETFQVIVALLLTIAAAVMSSGSGSRESISNYLSEALAPGIADLGPYPIGVGKSAGARLVGNPEKAEMTVIRVKLPPH